MAEAKLLKTTPFSEKDRLSNLPDELICHILSFLPTKVAYKTSVLSTRWTSLCTKVPDLHFKLPHSESNRLERSVSIHSVSAGLLRRTEKIRKLSLHSVCGCESYAVPMWVTKALDLGVEELDLHFVLNGTTIFLPRRLSTLESLVVLKLQGNVQPSLTSVTYLPSLKILDLDVSCLVTENVNRDYLSAFLSGCPRLEELHIRGYLKFPLEISLNFLKRLCLYLKYCSRSARQYLRILNLPSIETLDIHDYSVHKYEVVNLLNVDQATLDISKHYFKHYFDNWYKLMEGLSNVKSLYLKSGTVEFLSRDNLDNLRHLQFHNLFCLRVQISENCNWDILVSFLQNAPNLEVLIIEKCFKRNFLRSKVGNSGWTGPTMIPTCLLTNLKVLEFRGIQNFKTEMDFTQYIIDNSTKLGKVKLFTPKSRMLKVIGRNLFKRRNKASVFTWILIHFEDHLNAYKYSTKTT